jgi:hypothetical protein
MTTAEHTVGNNLFAVAGFGGEYGGYFAYQIILGTSKMEFYTVLVDPGNGHVLATQKVSAAELEKMHQEHSAEVVQSGGHSGVGFPFLIPTNPSYSWNQLYKSQIVFAFSIFLSASSSFITSQLQ